MDPPFVGRHDEQGHLRSLMSAAAVGQSSIVVIAGPAGIGKSSLIHQARAAAPDELDARLVTRCSEFDTAPTDPLDRLRQRIRGPEASLDQSLAWPAVVGAADRLASFDRQALGSLVDELLATATGPVMVVVDDLHWARPAVLDFVELIAVEIDAHRRPPILLVLATRPLPPEHETAARLDRLGAETTIHHLDLEPIDEAADADLVRSIAPRASITMVNYVRRAAGGNPLMTMATLGLLRGRHLPPDLPADDPRAWPTLIQEPKGADPLEEWLGSLPDEVVEVCGALAATGDEATTELAVVALGGQPRAQVVAALNAAIHETIVASSGDWHWFGHDLYREYFYRRLDGANRRSIHSRLARHLIDRGPSTRSERIQLCRHLLEGDSWLLADSAAIDALAEGARAAFGARSWAESARFYEAHIDRRHRLDQTRPEALPTSVLLLESGLAHYFNVDSASAMSRLDEALRAAELSGDDEQQASALVPLLRIHTARDPAAIRNPADVPELHRFLAGERHPLARSQVLQARAESLITAGMAEEGEAVASEAMATAIECDDQLAIAFASLARGYGALVRCAPVEAMSRLEQALAAAKQTDDWYALNTIRMRLAFAGLAAGDVKEATALADEVEPAAGADRDFANLGLSHAVQGTASYLQGDFSLAARRLEAASSEGRRAGYAAMPLFVLPTRVLNASAMDETSEIAGMLALLPRSISGALRGLVSGDGIEEPLRRPRHRTDVAAGLAAATMLAGVDPTAERPPEGLGDLIEMVEDMIESGLEIPGTMPILLRRALARSLVATGRVDDALAHLAEADRVCRDQDSRCELSLTLLEAAMANARQGREEEAMGQALEADVLARRLGMPATAAAARRLHRLRRPAPEPGRQLSIMVSDVAGSTVVGQRLGDRAYFELVMEHHALVRQLLGVHGGTEFSEGGDSLLAWFDAASDALDCAVAIQEGAARRRRTGSLLETKVGVAQGHPFFSHGRPYGSVVNRASRLAAFARANQIAIDEETMAGIGSAPIDLRTTAVDLRGIGRETVGIIAVADQL